MKKNRAGLTANGKKNAVLRCENIEAALHSLLFDVLNGRAYCVDMDKVSHLISSVQGLRYRFEDYPELANEPHERRIQELLDSDRHSISVARAQAKSEEAAKRERHL